MAYSAIADMFCLSEKSIRRIVLNEKKRMEPEKMRVGQIVKEFGVVGDINQIYTSAWEINHEYVLKKYTDINELQRNVSIISILFQSEVPVPQIVKLNDGRMYYEDEGQYWVLTTKLKGCNVIDITKCDNEWFYKMGRIIAGLHLAFDNCEDKISFWNNSLLGEMESWIRKNITESKVSYVDISELESVINELKKVDDKLSRGLIHRDVHLGNFLFDNGQFSGYIDFDLSQSNIRIFDICYFMLGLLLDEDENRVNEKVWFEYLSHVVNGYNSLIQLSKEERNSIALVMECIELLFVAYFIGKQDDKAAKDSAKLYRFCRDNHDKINGSYIK